MGVGMTEQQAVVIIDLLERLMFILGRIEDKLP